MKFLLWISGILVSLYVAFLLLFPSYTHRYRITVEIEADGEVHSGSGVVEVTYNVFGPLQKIFSAPWKARVTGHPPLVDLGQHGTVLAVLRPRGAWGHVDPRPVPASIHAFRAYYGPKGIDRFSGRENKLQAIRTIGSQSGRKTLDKNSYPAFVWLPHPEQRQGAIQIDPSTIHDLIDDSVGIRRVTLEITDAEFSNKIFEDLPWLQALRDREKVHGTRRHAQRFTLTANQILGDL